MELLKAGHDAQINLAFRTVVLGLPAEYPAAVVHRVPAMVAAQGGALPQYRTVTRSLISRAFARLSAAAAAGLWGRGGPPQLRRLHPQSATRDDAAAAGAGPRLGNSARDRDRFFR